MSSMPVSRRAAALLVGLTLVSCRSTPDPMQQFAGDGEVQITQDQLRDRLEEFTLLFSSTLRRASSEINHRSGSLEHRRKTIEWRSMAIPAVRRAASLPNPLEAFVDTWILCFQQRAYFEEGGGADNFGEHQPIASEAAGELEQDIKAIGRSFMDDESLARAQADVERFANNHPVKGSFARQANLPSGAHDDAYLDWIVTKRLKAFNPFSGIDAGALAIKEFTEVADEFKSIVVTMPEELSWRIETMFCDIEERQTMIQVRENLDGISRSALSLSESARTLPDDVKEVITHAFDELEEGQRPLQQTLADARSTVGEMTAALEQAERVATAFHGAIDSATAAGEAWQGVGAALGLDGEEEPSQPAEEEGPSFAEELDRAAQSVTTAALELRGMVADVRALAEGSEGDALIEAATASTRATIDHAMLRAVQLLLVLLAVGLVYQLVVVRLRRRVA